MRNSGIKITLRMYIYIYIYIYMDFWCQCWSCMSLRYYLVSYPYSASSGRKARNIAIALGIQMRRGAATHFWKWDSSVRSYLLHCVCVSWDKSLWKGFISKETDERMLNRRTNSVFILISLLFCVGMWLSWYMSLRSLQSQSGRQRDVTCWLSLTGEGGEKVDAYMDMDRHWFCLVMVGNLLHSWSILTKYMSR